MEQWWNNWEGKTEVIVVPLLLPQIPHEWGANPDLHREKSAANRPSCDVAPYVILFVIIVN